MIKKTRIAYETEDNDKNILFSPHLFRESLKEYACDNEYLRPYTVETLKARLEYIKEKIPNIPSDIVFKIECIIKFVKSNQDTYAGIRTVF